MAHYFHNQKVGRNDPCPCGSGKKFKKCHGDVTAQPSLKPDAEAIKRKIAEMEGLQKQREQQQGLGKPIISTLFHGYRFVAVGGRLFYSKNWRTFHDFLFDYIKKIVGETWGNEELKKPQEERHPLLNWYEIGTRYMNSFIKEPGKIHSAQPSGAAAGYLILAYNLYLVAHNAKLQRVLVDRLKKRDQFFGAYYEAYVAGALIKAGFEIEFEDESDSTTSHCELTAIFRKTGRMFSVEAKTRGPNKASIDVGNQLYAALKKRANHSRVIFIEANVPVQDEQHTLKALSEVLNSIRSREGKITIDGQPASPAYVVVTNNPHNYSLNDPFRHWAVAEGFKIADFKIGVGFATLRDAIKARGNHIEMYGFVKSLAEHDWIPSTFDGEIPEFAISPPAERLRVGERYAVLDAVGNEILAELVDAVVMEDRSVACCVMKAPGHGNFLTEYSLSKDELTAYKMHPDTFFGVYKPQTGKIKDPVALYEWFLNGYRETPKERLLEFLKGAPNYEILKSCSRDELAEICCEGWTDDLIRSGAFKNADGISLPSLIKPPDVGVPNTPPPT
jgi:hypothetical protein